MSHKTHDLINDPEERSSALSDDDVGLLHGTTNTIL